MFIIFILYFQTAGPFEERGMVMGVLDKAFDVFIMKFGVIKRVYCDVRYIFIKHNKCELWYIDVTKDWEVFTTNGTYPWSLVTQIFHNSQPSHGYD
jgi:hypothetical protein